MAERENEGKPPEWFFKIIRQVRAREESLWAEGWQPISREQVEQELTGDYPNKYHPLNSLSELLVGFEELEIWY